MSIRGPYRMKTHEDTSVSPDTVEAQFYFKITKWQMIMT